MTENFRLRTRALQLTGAALLAVALISLLPGLGDVRHQLSGADPRWLTLAGVFELLSCLTYVAAFRNTFDRRMDWKRAYDIAMASLAANVALPAGQAGGLALGAWALKRAGMPRERIARRTAAFFFLTSVPNVAAVAVIGLVLSVTTHLSLALTLAPAAVALMAMLCALGIPRVTSGRLTVLGEGIQDAVGLLRRGDLVLLGGLAGYMVFDIATLWAAFLAFGAHPAVLILALAYLLGQLGGLLPIPGGIGGVDGGLIAALTLYGSAASTATAAVLAYRALSFWVPALVGGVSLARLRGTVLRAPVAAGPAVSVV